MKSASLFIVTALFAIGLSCAKKNENRQETETAANPDSSAVAAKTAAAAPQTNTETAPATMPAIPPDSLVRALYRQHDSGKSPFFQTKSRPLVETFFTKKTAALIWNDAVSANGEVGKIDADPLYNTQDADIKNVAIQPPVFQEANQTADVLVTFTNYGYKEKIRFQLIQEAGGWKISDIHYANDLHLLQWLGQ